MSIMVTGTELPTKFVMACGAKDWHDADLRRRGYVHCSGCRRDVPLWFMATNNQKVARCRECLTDDPRGATAEQRRQTAIDRAAATFRAELNAHQNVPTPEVLKTAADYRRDDLIETLARIGRWATTRRVAKLSGYDARVVIPALNELVEAGLVERDREFPESAGRGGKTWSWTWRLADRGADQ